MSLQIEIIGNKGGGVDLSTLGMGPLATAKTAKKSKTTKQTSSMSKPSSKSASPFGCLLDAFGGNSSSTGTVATKDDGLNTVAPTRKMDDLDQALMRTSDWHENNKTEFQLEDRVALASRKAAFVQGTVLFVGPVHFDHGIWVGVQLTGPSLGRGDCNGKYKGKRYFANVGKNNGVMAPIDKVYKRELAPIPVQSVSSGHFTTKSTEMKPKQDKKYHYDEATLEKDLDMVDILVQNRALAILRIEEQNLETSSMALFMKNKELEPHIARLKQMKMAESLVKQGGVDAKTAAIQTNKQIHISMAPCKLKYAPRDAPLCVPDLELAEGLEKNHHNYCLSDPTLPDNPITYASQSFLNMTQYSLNEILGKNCRFLQGKATDPYAVYRLRMSIQEGSDCHVVLTNYRKDGSVFYNRLFMTALRDTKGRIKNYLGVQCQVSKAMADKINSQEKMKLERRLQLEQLKTNHPDLYNSLVPKNSGNNK